LSVLLPLSFLKPLSGFPETAEYPNRISLAIGAPHRLHSPIETITSPDATSDTPPRVPWWRHRRRLFWLAVTLAAIGLPWGGWVWWYRADFRMPPSAWMGRFGVDLGQVRTMDRWLQRQKAKLVTSKINRETHRLFLAGSTWKNIQTGARLTFGHDGLLQFESSPSNPLFGELLLKSYHSESLAALAALQGSRYDFHPQTNIASFSTFHGVVSVAGAQNMSLPSSPWQGLIYCNNDRSRITFQLIPKDSASLMPVLYDTFERVPYP
jgi:hypothetical protein